jgi:TorA maturation chaperone TorD
MANSEVTSTATAVAAADLLAHWWSRPVQAEVNAWTDAAATFPGVRERLTSTADGPALTYSPQQVGELLDEYEDLFVGPGQLRCPPYESFWRDDAPIDLWHTLMGPCTADLRQLYRDLGIDMAQDAGELPDHIAVEFEALAYALSRPDGCQVARSLISDHLGRWLPSFCKQVTEQAKHPFYVGLAATTLDWFGQIHLMVEAMAADQAATPAPSGSP